MDGAKIENIRQPIEALTEQIIHFDASMSVTILTRSVLKKDVTPDSD